MNEHDTCSRSGSERTPQKRPRLSNDDNDEKDTTILLKPDIQQQILSYLDTEDLCCWDLVCRNFSRVSNQQWGWLANFKYGLSKGSGKEGWKLGFNMVEREPILVEMADEEDFGYGSDFLDSSLVGSPFTTANQSMLVTVTDTAKWIDRGPMSFPVGRNAIAVRDASTLNYIRSIPSPIHNFRVAICGRHGCDIIVTSNDDSLFAIRGNQQQTWSIRSILPEEERNDARLIASNGIPLLSSERNLIIAFGGRLFLYNVNLSLDGGDDSLLTLQETQRISEDLFATNAEKVVSPQNLAWSPCQNLFAFFEPNQKSIWIWRLDRNKGGSMHPVQSIATELDIETSVAFSEQYVIGSNKERQIYVWDRETGEMCHEDLCDTQRDYDEDEFIYPLSMIVVGGDMLATSSVEGNNICFWNLQTGKLLKRGAHILCGERGEVTSAAHLKELNAIIFLKGSMVAMAFPTSHVMNKKALSIRRRERNIKRAIMGLRQGEMPGDHDYSDNDYDDYSE